MEKFQKVYDDWDTTGAGDYVPATITWYRSSDGSISVDSVISKATGDVFSPDDCDFDVLLADSTPENAA